MDPRFGETIYYLPYARFGPFQIGVLFGVFYFEYMVGEEDEQKRSLIGYKVMNYFQRKKWGRRLIYAISLTVLLGYINFAYPEQNNFPEGVYSKWETSLYNSTCRLIIVCMTSIIIAGPLVGKGSLTKKLFGAKFWAPFSKITFSAYLIHILVYSFFVSQSTELYYATHQRFFLNFFAYGITTILLAFPVSALFEAPWMQLEKLVMFPEREKDEKAKLETRSSTQNTNKPVIPSSGSNVALKSAEED